MSTLDQALMFKYMALTFEEIKYPTPVYSHLITSNDGLKWFELKKYDFGWRDPSIIKYNDTYYIAVGNSIQSTKDFDTFRNNVILFPDGQEAHWATEFFTDLDGTIKAISAVSTNANDPKSFGLRVYNINFESESATVANDIAATWEVGSPIDPNITVKGGKLILFVSESDKRLHQYVGDSITSTFKPVTSNLLAAQGDTSNEAPELLLLRDNSILYCDPWFDEDHRVLNYMTTDHALTNFSRPMALDTSSLGYRPRHFGVFKTGVDPSNQNRPVFQYKKGYCLSNWEAIEGKPNVATGGDLVNYQLKHGENADQLPIGTTFKDIVANIKAFNGEWINTKYQITDAPDGKGDYCNISVHKATNLGGGYILYAPYSSNDLWFTNLNGKVNEWVRLPSQKIYNYADTSLKFSDLIANEGGITSTALVLDCNVDDAPSGIRTSFLGVVTTKNITQYTGTQIVHAVVGNTIYIRSFTGNPSVFSEYKELAVK